MDAVSYSGFRQNLKSFMKQVNQDASTLMVTSKNPEDTVVVMSKRDYDSMQETMLILSNTELMNKIRKGDAQIAAGTTQQHELLTDYDDE
ncbi:type II toxin-antitoxin system Phd/YefM family antitoxin [Lacticaseibacillus songhuajiangensis]|uniref:type II toxin-antitoxin system Phd/YefM family antitoxin n=1 Tax=Lacticaseibacillus songhuajiangensis TaxID=1296539 RepID=UPI000F7A7925|nr:type II toxin-antitoxin system Phd/YefM family antitoxin [Lacticaseibacillus songhuajiangensis]